MSLKVSYEYQWAAAIAKNDWTALESQIRSGLNVNRGPILHTAIQQRRFRIAEKLIDNGADVNKVNRKGKSPLQILIENHKLNPSKRASKKEAYLRKKKDEAEKAQEKNEVEDKNIKEENKENLPEVQITISACGDGVSADKKTKTTTTITQASEQKQKDEQTQEAVKSTTREYNSEQYLKEPSVLNFGRYLVEKGAHKINGINDGPHHRKYQEFYKRKTKLTRHEYDDLQDLIRNGNRISLERNLNTKFTVHCVGPNERHRRGMLHMAVIAPCIEIVKVLLDRGADPNLEDANGCTPLSMIFFPINYNDRYSYKNESRIPRELLVWNATEARMKDMGRNDMLVCIGQRLLQAGARFVPDHTPNIDKKSLQEKWPNCPLIIFWHLYSKGSESSVDAADPIIASSIQKKRNRRTRNHNNGRKTLETIKEIEKNGNRR